MKRIVKNPDVRRAEIIEAAKKLFEQKGYEQTSVEAIIQEVKIAKGTFYYYFKSKKDILSALVDLIAEDLEAHFKTILNQEHLTAIEKFQLMLRGEEKNEKTNPQVMELLHKVENRELQEELNIKAIDNIAPLIAQVLQEGYNTKIFKKEIDIASVKLLFAGHQFILGSGLFEHSPEEERVYFKALQSMFELLTGARPGSLHFIVP